MRIRDQSAERAWDRLFSQTAILLVAGISSACAAMSTGSHAGRRQVAELMPGVPIGYLSEMQRPDSLKLLPPPPARGSAAMAYDEEVRTGVLALRGTSRWELARADASLATESALETFECALGTAIDKETPPRLFQMLQRVIVDSGYATDGAKQHYQRTRPFVRHGDAMCTPEEDAELRKDGSYPSGHSALGWAATLVLAEVAPDRANALFKRGFAFGESRVVCNVHWQSDVVSGRTMGSATVARLHAVPEFNQDLAIAKGEVARARVSGLMPSRDCASEERTLEQPIAGAL